MYDFIIIGAGIGGLNVAYQILKRYPHIKLLILEKEKTLGGRVYTFKNKFMSVDAGAGRFNIIHSHLIALLKELDLYDSKIPLISSAVYAKSDGSGRFYNSILDSPKLVSDYSDSGFLNSIDFIPNISKTIQLFVGLGLDIAMGKENLPNIELIFRVIAAGSFERKEKLIKMTFLEYAATVLTHSEIAFLKDSFGYYSEIVVMNAYDSIRLLRGLDPKNTFYTLKGGLSSIISALEKKILGFKGARILKNRAVSKINYLDGFFDVNCGSVSYKGLKCICALPKQIIERFPIFRPILSVLDKIKCAPLCRIYSRFSVESSSGVWFKGLPKFSTNNNLRMVIPISEATGVIMISYTDNIFADFWQRLYKRSGISGVDKELNRLMKLSTGIDIPAPLETHVFYWDCGAGYWGVGADSSSISESIIHPFPDKPLFICGEHYSDIGQQWMEGALETGDRILKKL